jgi:aldehyde dehydrogenase (NAD+)
MTRGCLFIGGRWQAPHDGGTREVENPATEQVIARVAEGGPRDVDDAVSSARAAFPAWSGLAVADRVAVLERWYDELRAACTELVATTVAEVGAPVAIAREAHVDLGLAVLRGYLDASKDVGWEEQVGSSLVLREAAGVAACITPWNYPFYQVLAKLGGALVAGCTVVLKPAELTPLSAYLLVEAAERAGLPAGVLNLVPGAGSVVGEAMVTHPDVDLVSFTGSTGVGARITALAAPTVKRVCLELGGKSASIVLDDADLVAGVTGTVHAAMLNSGQTCSAWSRLLVPAVRVGEAEEIAAAAVADLVLGDPLDERTWLGPVVSAAQRATVAGFVDRAVAAGARLVAGGSARPVAVGHFHAATVLSGVAPDAEVVREEVFGPVLTIQGFDSDDEAVAMANATAYGLHGGVWSADPARARGIARRLRTGQVDVNGAAFNPAAPFGGYGRSGNGRELGRFGIEEFLETKSVQQ